MRQYFGENFRDNLLNDFNDEQLDAAKDFLLSYWELKNLKGLTFFDAGCGSGVYTLAASLLGAKVTSFDIDDVALTNTQGLLVKQNITDVTLLKGSILDEVFLNRLGQFDVVLCWGVAHHSGEMWKCVDLMTKLVTPKGKLHLGIYNHADGWGLYPDGRFGQSSFWEKIKYVYVRLPKALQRVIDWLATAGIVLIYLITFNNPIKKLKSNQRRGMNWQSDLKDWLIAYPHEVFSFV